MSCGSSGSGQVATSLLAVALPPCSCSTGGAGHSGAVVSIARQALRVVERPATLVAVKKMQKAEAPIVPRSQDAIQLEGDTFRKVHIGTAPRSVAVTFHVSKTSDSSS